MRRLFLFITGLLFCQVLSAQADFPSMPGTSPEDTLDSESVSVSILDDLNVNQDSRLEKMLNWHVENNKKRDGMEGYRVEIYSSSAMNARQQAQEKKVEFLSEYPDRDVHIQYSAPNFRVRVGDFRTRNEALKLRKMIQRHYPGAFIVPDIIDFPLLKPEEDERPD